MFTFLAVLVSACSGGSGHASPATSSTLGPNPDVVPQVITADYVNAVFKVLNHLDGDVTRSLVAGGTITAQDYAILRAIYNDPLYQQEVNIAQQTLKGDLSVFRDPPGDRVTQVRTLVDTSSSCIFAATMSDYSAVAVHPTSSAQSEYWELTPKQVGGDPEQLNPTPWALSFNASYTAVTTIPDQCGAQ